MTDTRTHEWVKSTYSGGDGGQCLEWAPAAAAVTGIVPVRDSKAPEGPSLAVSGAAWTGLVEFAKAASL
ncbi:DUF397 domain-containing protein [Streptomyces sp. NPDC059452]|uniref:DUF397 domain-containing protein n=1 Tax=Streptomyces sp. NPDC059452 TaxID=3346835 RepID=UPI0036B91C64